MIRKFIAVFMMIFFATSTTFAADKIKTGEDWDKGLIVVEGNAAGQSALKEYPRFYKNSARQGARIDALRQFAEYITSKNVADFMKIIEIDNGYVIRTKVSLDGSSKIIEMGAKQIGDAIFDIDYGICTVYVGLPIFGENSLAQAHYLHLKDETKENFPQPTVVENISEKYTGLIVDCRGLEVYRTLDPFICYDLSEKESITIYGTQFLDFNKIGSTFINQGIVSYVRDVKDATRAGNNPLLVKAVASKFGRPVVSVADADKILNANKNSGFLDSCAVVFLCDKFI